MASVTELVGKLASGDQGEQFQGYFALEQMVYKAGRPGADVDRNELAVALAAEFNAMNETKNDKGEVSRSIKYSPVVRRQIARLLTYVAGEAEIPALKTALEDFDAREMSRWSLDGITTPAATALLAAASQNNVGPEFLVGVINALGYKSGPEALGELKRQCLNDDVEIRTAAAEALANFPDVSNDKIFDAVLKFGEPTDRVRTRLLRARLRLAETLARDGQTEAAKTVYQAILASASDTPQAAAAKAALEQLG